MLLVCSYHFVSKHLEIALYRLGGPELAYNKNIITI